MFVVKSQLLKQLENLVISHSLDSQNDWYFWCAEWNAALHKRLSSVEFMWNSFTMDNGEKMPFIRGYKSLEYTDKLKLTLRRLSMMSQVDTKQELFQI